jgi:hypothetical protein
VRETPIKSVFRVAYRPITVSREVVEEDVREGVTIANLIYLNPDCNSLNEDIAEVASIVSPPYVLLGAIQVKPHIAVVGFHTRDLDAVNARKGDVLKHVKVARTHTQHHAVNRFLFPPNLLRLDSPLDL